MRLVKDKGPGARAVRVRGAGRERTAMISAPVFAPDDFACFTQCADTADAALDVREATVLDRMIAARLIQRMARAARTAYHVRKGHKLHACNDWQVYAAHCSVHHYWTQRRDALVQAGIWAGV